MRFLILTLSLTAMTLAGCSSIPRQNHLGLVAAPSGIIVDSKRVSDPSPIASTGQSGWKRSWLDKQAESRSVERDAPYSSLK